MMLYVESKAFPPVAFIKHWSFSIKGDSGILNTRKVLTLMSVFFQNIFTHYLKRKTFIILCKLTDTIARARSQMLHILWELGRDDHQFRFRYRGQYLRDAYTFEDYEIPENAVVKMVPMAKRQESFVDLRRMDGQSDLGQGTSDEVLNALNQEIQVFVRREKLLAALQAFLWLWALATMLSFITNYFYSGFWNVIIVYFLFKYCPTFTRTGGFVGRASQYNKVVPVMLVPAPTGCFGQAGDFVEQHLVKTRDVEKVLFSARNGKIKEKRNAAFELASFAACSDDNKYKIVSQGGMEVLSNLSLSRDEATQEYATEAIAELLTLPEIQDQFVAIGGVRTLCALLHGRTDKIIYEAATALFYLISDNDNNKMVIVEDTGLDDLAHASMKDNIKTARVLAGVFLELLSYNADLREIIASRNVVAVALVHLCQLADSETQQLSLQALELIAIESPESVVTQEDLLHHLVAMPRLTEDERLHLLSGKIMLYFAENEEACSELINVANLTDTLLQFAQSNDSVLQNVVSKIILAILENQRITRRIPYLGLDKVVMYLQSNSVDRHIFDNADAALNLLTIYTSEDKMGSSLSLKSVGKPGQSGYGV
ncbi:uncharacterized protein TRIADDRAFT_57378 [Trichoplax adhaerens]|uniref:Ubiquitin-like domain-containing protein n=1 Tax=Trichoplax adhaerens TaxID=10228 RepID=B3RZA0_TRIAD|nr:hypothetical protein TRIADDRAFT_57378 [Trichoplax adhaerens]EDV23805.1 hypothetical protein TRIADDRAFT_57378 [Trichoplax adhaerens]|eukprot:XP_002113331.1 hypothetical protein TRIADDRAFT_57378 [Trichoplax adhaerens]